MVNDQSKYFVFNGKKSSDFNVWASGLNIFTTPRRNVERVSVPGRNGDLLIDDGTFENAEMLFKNCFIPNKFSENFTALSNYLSRQQGYKRLELSWLPDEYRMAAFNGDIEASLKNWDGKGSFDLAFDCKPQRFLKSGEEPIVVMVPIVNGNTMRTSTYQFPAEGAKKNIRVTATSLPESGSISVQVVHHPTDSEAIDFSEVKTISTVGEPVNFAPRPNPAPYGSWDMTVTAGSGDNIDDICLTLQCWVVVNGQEHYYDSTFAREMTIKNPTGFECRPTIECYGTAIPYLDVTAYDEDGAYETWSLNGWDFTGTGAPYAVLDCENEYCYSPVNKENLTQYITMHHDDEDGNSLPLCFPRMGASETSLYMYYVGSGTSGEAFMFVYPNWFTI